MSAFLAFRTAAFSLLKPRISHIQCRNQLAIRTAHTGPTRLRDHDIPFKIVQLVDPVSGKLSEPMPLTTILKSIPNKKLEYVELVSEDPAPVVKIINKKEAFEKRKLAKRKASVVAKKNVQKEVQLTWGAAEGDFAHKIGRVREELGKGHRIDLVFSHKKGQDLPTPEEMQKQVQNIVEMVADVGKEWKPPEYRGKIAAVFLQGTTSSETVITPEDLLPRKEKLKIKRLAREAEKEKKLEQKRNSSFRHL